MKHKGSDAMPKTIGERLRELRKEKNLTLDELSARCGLSSQSISYYELDKGVDKISVLLALAKGLGCTIFDIIDEPLGRENAMCIHAPKCMFYQRELQEKI